MGSVSRTALDEDEIRLRADYDPAEDPDTGPPASGDGP